MQYSVDQTSPIKRKVSAAHLVLLVGHNGGKFVIPSFISWPNLKTLYADRLRKEMCVSVIEIKFTFLKLQNCAWLCGNLLTHKYVFMHIE